MPNFTYKNDHVTQTIEVTRTICECGKGFTNTHDCEKHYVKEHVLCPDNIRSVAGINFYLIDSEEKWNLCVRHWFDCGPFAWHRFAGSRWAGPGWYGVSTHRDSYGDDCDYFETRSVFERMWEEEIEELQSKIHQLKELK